MPVGYHNSPNWTERVKCVSSNTAGISFKETGTGVGKAKQKKKKKERKEKKELPLQDK